VSKDRFLHIQKYETGWYKGSVITVSEKPPPGDGWAKCIIYLFTAEYSKAWTRNGYTVVNPRTHSIVEDQITAYRYFGPKKRKGNGSDEFVALGDIHLIIFEEIGRYANDTDEENLIWFNMLEKRGFSHLTATGNFINIKKLKNRYDKKNHRKDVKGELVKLTQICRLQGPVYKSTFQTKNGEFVKDFSILIDPNSDEDRSWNKIIELIWISHHIQHRVQCSKLSNLIICDYEFFMNYRMIPHLGNKVFYLDGLDVDLDNLKFPKLVSDFIKEMKVTKIIDG